MMTREQIDNLVKDRDVTFISLCKYMLPSGKTLCFIDFFHEGMKRHEDMKRQDEISIESYDYFKAIESVNHDNSIYTKRIK
ncbi:MAG: hypothetical protein LBS20_07520 [Prevotella sp.]|jgi:hypothetical protein|nr:hypothetical protein [Prevotella sp.]